MKDEKINRNEIRMVCISRFCFATILTVFGYLSGAAQKIEMQTAAMRYGESATYDVYFKWGLIMSRAGEATFTYDKNFLIDHASSRYSLLFKTAKFFDNFFKMRDTINNYYNNNNQLLYSEKKSDEGGYYLIDELTFNYKKDNTTIHSFRYTPSRVKIDTLLATSGKVMDMLGVVYYMRGLKRNQLKTGNIYPVTVAIGRDLIKMQLCYQKPAIISHDNAKYNTHYFKLNIYDKAFESTNASVEVWIGDDDNFLPIKVRSKLKIGYAEVYFKQIANQKHPLKCMIETQK